MKKYFLVSLMTFLLAVNAAFAQKIHKSSVPSIIVNNFHQNFPRAYDVEWKLENELYKVEFETGLRRYDHTVWFDSLGQMKRHKEEISKSKLPAQVTQKINSDFAGYRISDVKKITERKSVLYTLEVKRFNDEWKVSIDSDGNIISKIPD